MSAFARGRRRWMAAAGLALAAVSLADGDHVAVDLPRVLLADFTDGVFYAGSVQLAARAADPDFGRDKVASYSIDGVAGPFLPANAQDSSGVQLVNQTTASQQILPAVASLAGGGFVAAWSSFRGGANNFDIMMRRYDSGAKPRGGEVAVPTHLSGLQDQAAVAGLSNHNFVITWSSFGQAPDGDGYGVFAQVFDEDGGRVGSEFLVNTLTAGDQSASAVAGLDGGGFIVVWQSWPDANGTARGTIHARRFTNDGTPVDTLDFDVDLPSPDDHGAPCVTALDGGGYAVGWTAPDLTTHNPSVWVEMFGPGDPHDPNNVIAPFYAGRQSSASQGGLSLAPRTEGGLVAVWSTASPDPHLQGVFGHAYNADGNLVGGTTRIDQPSAGGRVGARIARLGSGFHAVTWVETDAAGRGRILTQRFATGSAIQGLGVEWPVSQSLANHQRPAAVALGGDQFAVAWQAQGDPLDTSGAGVLLQSYTDLQLTSLRISPGRDIDVVFRLSTPGQAGRPCLDGVDWCSPTASFRYGDPDGGRDGQVAYTPGYTSAASVSVGIVRPDAAVGYLANILHARTAPLAADSCGVFGDWTIADDEVPTTASSSKPIPLQDATCVQFKWVVTNGAHRTFEYASDGVIRVDQTAPAVTATYQQVGAELAVTVRVVETASTASLSFARNGSPPVPFSGTVALVPLTDGANNIRIDAVDAAGNVGQAGFFVSADLTPPRIDLYTIEEGATYGPDVPVGYTLTRPLTGLRMSLDGEDRPVGDLFGIDAGSHVLTLAGVAEDGREASTTVRFAVAPEAGSFALLSPQARTYAEDRVTVTFDSSAPVTATSVVLDGAGRAGLVLDGLADGTHVLEFSATLATGRTVSITRQFTVALAAPRLVVRAPVDGAMLQSRGVTVDLDANGPVTYRAGAATGSIVSGQALQLPDDGDQVITFTATLPNGASASRSIAVHVDSLAPQVAVTSPAARLYAFRGVPITWSANKSLVDVTYQLDGQAVTGLEDLPDGPHHFSLAGRDHTGRSVQASVDFRVAHLEILSPAQGDMVVDNDFPPRVNLAYDSGGLSTLTASVDEGAAQLLPSASGAYVLQPGAGSHEVTVSGRFNDSTLTRRVAFTVGARNVLAGRHSIRYQYANCTDDLVCDTTVTLQVTNPGDYDVAAPFDVVFETREAAGATRRYTWPVDGLQKGERRAVTLSPFSARFEDRFRLEVDPGATLPGEDRRDNVQEVTFQPGKILDVVATLSPENTYVQGARVDNLFGVAAVGGVAYVELQAGTYYFRDDSGENGYLSPVDMGMLSPERNFVIIRAYAADNTLLDTAKRYFKVLRPSPTLPTDPRLSPWLAFVGAGNRIFINDVDQRELARQELVSLEKMALAPVAFYATAAGKDAQGQPLVGYGVMTSDDTILAGKRPDQMGAGAASSMTFSIGALGAPAAAGTSRASASSPGAGGVCLVNGFTPIVETAEQRARVHETFATLQNLANGQIEQLLPKLQDTLNAVVDGLPHGWVAYGLNLAWMQKEGPSMLTLSVNAAFLGYVHVVPPTIHVRVDFTNEIERFELRSTSSDCLVALDGSSLVVDSQVTFDLDYLRSVSVEVGLGGAHVSALGLFLGESHLTYFGLPLPIAWAVELTWADTTFYDMRFGGRLATRIHGSGGLHGTEPALTIDAASVDVRIRFPRQQQRAASSEAYSVGLIGVLYVIPVLHVSKTVLDTDVTLQFDSDVHFDLAAPVTLTNPGYILGQIPLTRDFLVAGGQVLADASVHVHGWTEQCFFFFCFTIDVDIAPFNVADDCWGINAQGENVDLPRDACPAEVTAPLDPPPLPPPS